MGVAQALKNRALDLRKARDELAGSFQMVLGYAQASAKERALKGGTADVGDEDAMRALAKGIKQVRDTIANIEPAGGQDTDLYKRSKRELEELEALLPSMASDDEILAEAQAVQSVLDPGLVGMKRMGPTMAHLQTTFGITLDNGRASSIVKELLMRR